MIYYDHKCHTTFALARKATKWKVAWLSTQQGRQRSQPTSAHALRSWSPSPARVLKVNLHGTLHKQSNFGAAWTIIRNSTCTVLEASSLAFSYASAYPLCVEVAAVIYGPCEARLIGAQSIIIKIPKLRSTN